MSQPTNLSAGSALGRQTCFVKYNINLLARSAPGRQTCRLAHVRFCLKNWATAEGVKKDDNVPRQTGLSGIQCFFC
jgi:hypothetical protein